MYIATMVDSMSILERALSAPAMSNLAVLALATVAAFAVALRRA